jgi:hypothetical protein
MREKVASGVAPAPYSGAKLSLSASSFLSLFSSAQAATMALCGTAVRISQNHRCSASKSTSSSCCGVKRRAQSGQLRKKVTRKENDTAKSFLHYQHFPIHKWLKERHSLLRGRLLRCDLVPFF